MKKYLFISSGGFIGAILRYQVINIHIYHYNELLNILVINLIGSFLLAFILVRFIQNSHLQIGLTTGFLGAFTTFSTLCKTIFVLIHNQQLILALIYLSLSIIIGLGSAYLGASFAIKPAKVMSIRNQVNQ